MPLLDDLAVAQALASLSEWSGDSSRISRTLQAGRARSERLHTAVMAAADAMDHHPVVEQDEHTMTFVVWTHSAGGVTEKDLRLAEAIDDIIDRDDATQAP